MLSNINQCLFDIMLYNPYYFTHAQIPYNFLQKLYIFQFANQGILYLSFIQTSLLFVSLKLLPKPKYWARNKFWTILPYSQGALTLIWFFNRYIIPNEGFQFVFGKQIQHIQEQNLLQKPLLYNRQYIINKLMCYNEDQSKTTSNKKLSLNQKLKDANQIIIDKSLDNSKVRQIYQLEFDQQIYSDILLYKRDLQSYQLSPP
ncbi:unnamed protein product (macronuclear) [Paramecium tetraurelia]|uniref:Transmembrane protein n=1 Tax=Paramecium tetraurelia TaxID=5888 RepID=A0BAR0_PARTE|nr:uncharacterized protein GSPATT00000062001 [Paramecium tetraurelia]CAK55627.1 unnamed protein product [Paramecium tetraurelia]|eukprot:XP_001423025.1 hypothetical protein (macronuclear) [Paramecium tetraurelia strain d4-2]